MKLLVIVLATALATPVFAQSADARLDAVIAQSVANLPVFDAALAKNLKAMLDVRVPYGQGQSEDVWLGGRAPQR